MSSRDARIVAGVQCVTTIAALALVVFLPGAWYVRGLTALILVVVAELTLREWLRGRNPRLEHESPPAMRFWEFALVHTLVVAVGIAIMLLLPGPQVIATLLGLIWVTTCPWPVNRAWARWRHLS